MSEAGSLEQALRALADQECRRTPEQQAHYDRITARNEAIQAKAPKPTDGTTFGSGKPGKGS